jgi:hypothetical protein
MRDQEDYRLDIGGKYAFNAFALELQCDIEEAQKFINDCINEFNLFESDGTYFWSKSLLNRMKKRDEKSEKARENALKRWDNKQSNSNSNAIAMPTHSKGNAIKESKVKESKVNKNKEKERKVYGELSNVLLSDYEHNKLIEVFGQELVDKYIEKVDLYIATNGKKYKDFYAVIRQWINRDRENGILGKQQSSGNQFHDLLKSKGVVQ